MRSATHRRPLGPVNTAPQIRRTAKTHMRDSGLTDQQIEAIDVTRPHPLTRDAGLSWLAPDDAGVVSVTQRGQQFDLHPDGTVTASRGVDR